MGATVSPGTAVTLPLSAEIPAKQHPSLAYATVLSHSFLPSGCAFLFLPHPITVKERCRVLSRSDSHCNS